MAIITDTLIEIELEGGTRGLQGIQGIPGKDGKDGRDAKDGRDGKDGSGLYATYEDEILHLHTIENAEERGY